MKEVPTSSEASAVITGTPRPGELMNAAMVTIDSAAMTDWLTPTRMVRRDIGSTTRSSRWAPVVPSESVASSTLRSTPRTPSAVTRTTGGKAYTKVAITAGAPPMPKNRVTGSR